MQKMTANKSSIFFKKIQLLRMLW